MMSSAPEPRVRSETEGVGLIGLNDVVCEVPSTTLLLGCLSQETMNTTLCV